MDTDDSEAPVAATPAKSAKKAKKAATPAAAEAKTPAAKAKTPAAKAKTPAAKAKTPAATEAKTPAAKATKTPAAKTKTPAAKAKTPAAKAKTPAAKAKTPAKSEPVAMDTDDSEAPVAATPAKSAKKAKKAATPAAAEAKTPAAKAKTPAAKAKAKTPAAKAKAKTPAAMEKAGADTKEAESATPAKAKKASAKKTPSEKTVAERKKRLASAALSLGLIGSEANGDFLALSEELANDDPAEGSDIDESGSDAEDADGETDAVDKEDLAKPKAAKKMKKNADSKLPAITSKEGVIYLGHIPHGFYEEEMKGFFSQFGKVARLRLSRSTKTGRSRGYAFIQFDSAEVAAIVQKAMDKYILCEKLLQCSVVKPEDVHERMFNGCNRQFKKIDWQLREAKIISRKRTRQEKQQRNSRATLRQGKQAKRIKAMGIEYDFPTPAPAKA